MQTYSVGLHSISSVMSDSLWSHGLQHARPPCPSPTCRAYSNSCPLSWWCHPTVSPFSRLQSFPASESFPVSQFFTSGGQCIGASASVLLMNIQDWFPLGLTGYLLAVQGTFNSLQHHSSKASVLWGSAFFIVQLSHPYMTTGKTIALTRWIFVGKVMSLLLNMLSRLVIAFLPRSKRLLISWLQSPSAVILEPKSIKSLTVSTVPPSICHEVMGPDAVIFLFWMLSFRPTFSLSFTFTQHAAAAKSPHSCWTLCDPMDCSPPGSSVHRIFQTRVLQWAATAFMQHGFNKWKLKS